MYINLLYVHVPHSELGHVFALLIFMWYIMCTCARCFSFDDALTLASIFRTISLASPSKSLKLANSRPLGLLSHTMKMLCSTWPLCDEHQIIDAFVSPLAGYRVPYSKKKGLNDVCE